MFNEGAKNSKETPTAITYVVRLSLTVLSSMCMFVLLKKKSYFSMIFADVRNMYALPFEGCEMGDGISVYIFTLTSET